MYFPISRKTFEYSLLIFALLVGLALRLYKIDSPVADWHSWRQADTASVAYIYMNEGIDLLRPRFYDISNVQSGFLNYEGYRFVEFPFINAIHALLAKNFSLFSFDIWGRLISIFFSLVSTLAMFLIGKKLLGRLGGVLAAWFFATLPFNVYYSRVILPEPAAVCFGLLSILFFMIYVDGNRLLSLYSSGIFMALSLLLKPYTIFYALPIIYLAYKKFGIKGMLTNVHLYIYLDVALLPLLLWRTWTWEFPSGVPAYDWVFNGDKIRFRPAFWYWIFGQRIAKLILGFWGVVLVGFGLLQKKRDNPFLYIFGVGAFLYLSIVATANVRHDYYQVLIVPVIVLMLARGALFLYESKGFSRWLSVSILLVSSLFMYMFGWYEVKEYYKINHPEIVAAGQAVSRLLPKDAKVIAPYDGDTAFLYQLKRYGWPVNVSTIDELRRVGADYYVSVNFADKDTIEVLNRFKIIEKTDQYLIADLSREIR